VYHMELLERQKYLEELSRLSREAESGEGKTILISGESGVGKTSLIKYFTSHLNSGTEILWGACDDLFTPRPLGPLYDIGYQVNSELIKMLLKEDNRVSIFSVFLNYLQSKPGLKIIVIEDIHWADESTLDLIKFLTRRMNRTKALLILSYRDEDISRDNQVRLLFGDLPNTDIKRIRLYPLSEEAVSRLMKKAGKRNDNLYRITGGNPFYITELLESNNDEIPTSVKQAVVARTLTLNEDTRNFIELVSVIPTKVEVSFLGKLTTRTDEHIDLCVKKGILNIDRNLVSFRHELARLAILNSIPEMKRIRLNKQVLNILLTSDNPQSYLARIVHHAVQSNDADAVIKYAPLAAKQASSLGAHSLAAEHYLNALQAAGNISPERKLTLYEGRSYECYLTGQVEEGIRAGEEALEILHNFPDPAREAEICRKISRMLWYNCQDVKGEEYLDRAICIFEKLPVCRELAMAYSNKSQTYMIREETGKALKWSRKAQELARSLNDPEIEAHALNNTGSAKLMTGDYSGKDELKKSLDISLKHDFMEHAARAWSNLGAILLQHKNLTEADYYLTAGSNYSEEKDMYVFSLCLAGHHSKVKLHLGLWEEAVELAKKVFNNGKVPPGNRLLPQTVMGTIRARRNDPGAKKLLDELMEHAIEMGENEKLVAVEAARAECLWLHNKLELMADELAGIYERIKKSNNAWAIGEIAFWLWKAGNLNEVPENIAKPYLLQITGKWKEAAGLWEGLNCPYEQALALADGDERAMKRAVEIMDSLTASAASQLIKQKMRESGFRSIPRGPRQTTRQNDAGLTQRQQEVLNLISKGLSNIEIGNQLYISPKTVDHHISAILAKLNMHSRTEAASFAQMRGLI